MDKWFSEDFFVVAHKYLILREKKNCVRVLFFRTRPLFGSAPLPSVVLFVVLLARVRIYKRCKGGILAPAPLSGVKQYNYFFL